MEKSLGIRSLLPNPREALVLGSIGAVFVAICVWLIAQGAPLGHDEAVYALKARTLAQGASSWYFWNDYRAPGLPWFLMAVPSADAFVRLAVVVFGGLCVLLTWLIGRELFDTRVGLLAAFGLAFSPAFLVSSALAWPDVPGAAVGLGVLFVLLWSVRDDHLSWWVLLAAPLTVLATLIRFGAPLPIGVGVIAIAVWKRDLLRRSWRKVAVLGLLTGVGLLVVLAVPGTLGTATSPLSSIAQFESASFQPFYTGFVDYAKMYQFLLLNPLGMTLAIGIVWMMTVLIRDRERADRGRILLVTSIGLGSVFVIGATLHGEFRYLAPTYPWLWLMASVALVEGLRSMRSDMRRALGVSLIVLVVMSGVADWTSEVDKNKNRFLEIRTASREIDEISEDGGCAVVTGYTPQVAWYSRCLTGRFPSDGGATQPVFVDLETFVFFVKSGKNQPPEEQVFAYLQQEGAACATVGDPDGAPLRFVTVCPTGDD